MNEDYVCSDAQQLGIKGQLPLEARNSVTGLYGPMTTGWKRVSRFDTVNWGFKEYLGRDKDTALLLRNFTPAPTNKIADKYLYFFGPYSPNSNTSKYMNYKKSGLKVEDDQFHQEYRETPIMTE